MRRLLAVIGSPAFAIPLVCWFLFGFVFGIRGIIAGDDWYTIAASNLGHFPACVGIGDTFYNPWRPLHVTPICLLYHSSNSNIMLLHLSTVAGYALTALIWYCILRSLFQLDGFLALATCLILLAYPDDTFRLTLLSGQRMWGNALILLGCWLVLTYWDNHQRWRLAASLVSVGLGLLTYEAQIGLWLPGLPLALLVKDGRISRRWLLVSGLIIGVAMCYVCWRFIVLPSTYSVATLQLGGGARPLRLELTFIMSQTVDAFAQVGRLWAEAFRDIHGNVSDAILLQGVLGGLIAGLAVFLSGHNHKTSAKLRGPSLLASSVIMIPILALPFLVSDNHLPSLRYITSGTPFAASLGIIGLCLILRKPYIVRGLLVGVTAFTVSFGVVVTGADNEIRLPRTQMACDFWLRFTALVSDLPPQTYVVIRSRDDLTPLSYSAQLAMSYYDEQSVSDEFLMFGKHGVFGYYGFNAPSAEMSPRGIVGVDPLTAGAVVLHRFSPFPEIIPLDRSILLDYVAFERLSILYAPPSATLNATGSPSQAHRIAQHHCRWYDPRTI